LVGQLSPNRFSSSFSSQVAMKLKKGDMTARRRARDRREAAAKAKAQQIRRQPR